MLIAKPVKLFTGQWVWQTRYLSEGFGKGCSSGTGFPKSGVPSLFQWNGWMRGLR